jgi:DNA-binding NtrC family response regulator
MLRDPIVQEGQHPPKTGLLLVDDDPLIVESLGFIFQDEYEVYPAATRNAVKSLLHALKTIPSLALVDLGLPPAPHQPDEGFALIGELLAFNPAMKILVLSGQNTLTTIKHALTLGAVDFVPKPCDALLLKSRLQHQRLILEAERHDEAETGKALLLGESPVMITLRALIRQFADMPFSILIEGESGSGKELVAQALHSESQRAELPYLVINCAAFPADLLEAQLFGHSKGAFTGASAAKAGFFEAAGKGSLFLDEIGELPLALQSKLLRVIENGEYFRLGETQPRKSSARVIAATNQDLREAVRTGGFRQDLYHRLGVLSIKVPPLRERGSDMLLLLEQFQRLYAASIPPFRLSPAAIDRLKQYSFPGNVRELRNIVIRLAAKYPGQEVAPRQLEAELELEVMPPLGDAPVDPQDAVAQELKKSGFCLDQTLDAWERRYINAALNVCGGNLSQAAKMLGINRTTLYSKIQRLSAGER